MRFVDSHIECLWPCDGRHVASICSKRRPRGEGERACRRSGTREQLASRADEERRSRRGKSARTQTPCGVCRPLLGRCAGAAPRTPMRCIDAMLH